MAIITPAMHEINQGLDCLVPEWANKHADRIMEEQGINPLKAFEDPETRRIHYVEARDFWQRVTADEARNIGGIAIDLVTGKSLTSTAKVLREEGIV